MSRPLRLAFPGAIYHITSRGNARAAIYLDDDDRQASILKSARVLCSQIQLDLSRMLLDGHSLSSIDRNARREFTRRDAAAEWRLYPTI